MSQIEVIEEKGTENIKKKANYQVYGLIGLIITALIGAIVYASGSTPVTTANIISLPSTNDGKEQKIILDTEKRLKEQNKEYIKDSFYTKFKKDYNKRDTKTFVKNLIASGEKKEKKLVLPENHGSLQDTIKVVREEDIGVKRPKRRRKRHSPSNRPNDVIDNNIFASKMNNHFSGRNEIRSTETSRYGDILSKLSAVKNLSSLTRRKDYSTTISKGGMVEIIYNSNPTVTIMEGDFLECVLSNRIVADISETPAIVIVAKDFYDRSRKYVVIPKGTKILGYTRPVSYKGTYKISIPFRRMILPNGVSVLLSNKSIALDRYGSGGVASSVNRHFWLKYGTSFLVGLLDGLGGLAQNKLSQTSSASFMIEEIFKNFNNTNHSYLDQYRDVVPTVTVNAGEKILVYMAMDIEISAFSKISEMSYYTHGAEQ